jgi:hypothetical protein
MAADLSTQASPKHLAALRHAVDPAFLIVHGGIGRLFFCVFR